MSQSQSLSWSWRQPSWLNHYTVVILGENLHVPLAVGLYVWGTVFPRCVSSPRRLAAPQLVSRSARTSPSARSPVSPDPACPALIQRSANRSKTPWTVYMKYFENENKVVVLKHQILRRESFPKVCSHGPIVKSESDVRSERVLSRFNDIHIK